MGTVNSAAWTKPKYPSVHTAQNMQWSCRCMFKDFQINSMWLSMMGRWLDNEEPYDSLIPQMTCFKRRQFCRGPGKPC